MENFILAESYGRSNIQNRLWYVMSSDDLENVKAQFGDRAYAIQEGQTYYMGNDDTWYDQSGNSAKPSGGAPK